MRMSPPEGATRSRSGAIGGAVACGSIVAERLGSPAWDAHLSYTQVPPSGLDR